MFNKEQDVEECDATKASQQQCRLAYKKIHNKCSIY